MNGFTDDLLFAVTSDIIENWERVGGNVEYFADRVRKSGLTVADLDNYLVERGKVGPVCVTTVFNYIVHHIEDEKGGEA